MFPNNNKVRHLSHVSLCSEQILQMSTTSFSCSLLLWKTPSVCIFNFFYFLHGSVQKGWWVKSLQRHSSQDYKQKVKKRSPSQRSVSNHPTPVQSNDCFIKLLIFLPCRSMFSSNLSTYCNVSNRNFILLGFSVIDQHKVVYRCEGKGGML